MNRASNHKEPSLRFIPALKQPLQPTKNKNCCTALQSLHVFQNSHPDSQHSVEWLQSLRQNAGVSRASAWHVVAVPTVGQVTSWPTSTTCFSSLVSIFCFRGAERSIAELVRKTYLAIAGSKAVTCIIEYPDMSWEIEGT